MLQRNKPRAFALLIFLFSSIPMLSGQGTYPKDYFRAPLDIRMLLSGTFGEIRTNHFHSGIDIRTGGVEGQPVYAVADGFVSRIKISAYGFGKAMYVTHPNGYVSVYGHLQGFNKTIGDYVKKEHYRRENFEIELFPKEHEYPVKKGEIIAYTGNSGSSGGPHLHFEIRDGASQKPINPLLFGYEVKDQIRPSIISVKLYPESPDSKINGASKAIRYLTEGSGTTYRLAGNPAIKVSGNLSFAIQVSDQLNDSDNKNGPYSIRLFIDQKEVFSIIMNSFSFDDTRYVNSLLDFEEYARHNVRLQQTRIEPGNRMTDIYGSTGNKGVFMFNDTLTHTVTFDVADVAGNVSTLSFKMKASRFTGSAENPAAVKPSAAIDRNTKYFNFAVPNYYSNGSVSLDCPRGVFYDSFEFKYDSSARIKGTYALVHKIHNPYIPVHDFIDLSIKALNLPENLRQKALIVKVKDDGKSFTSVGGSWEGSGRVTTKIREFGNYTIAIDTLSPVVKALNAASFGNISAEKHIKIQITDDLSGIASYKGMLNGKWILMDYDAKNDVLIYTIDDLMQPGTNTLLVEVRDNKGNKAFYSARINQ